MKNNETYLLNLAKQASVFIMIACAYFNELIINPGIFILVILAIIYMFIPRKIILDKNVKQNSNSKLINMYIFLNLTKFISLVLLTLYIFFNTIMMEKIGLFVLIFITSFMIVPRKLIYILAEDDEI